MSAAGVVKTFIKVFPAGDETALESKVNTWLDQHPEATVVNLQVQQVQYHSRLGQIDFGFLAVITLQSDAGWQGLFT